MESDSEQRRHHPHMSFDDVPYYENTELNSYLRQNLGEAFSQAGLNADTLMIEKSDTDLLISCREIGSDRRVMLLILPYKQDKYARSFSGVRLSASTRSVLSRLEEKILARRPSIIEKIRRKYRTFMNHVSEVARGNAEFFPEKSFIDVLRNENTLTETKIYLEDGEQKHRTRLHERIKISDDHPHSLPNATITIHFYDKNNTHEISSGISKVREHLEVAEQRNFDLVLYEEVNEKQTTLWLYYVPSKKA